jgi:penicillin-binding protein 1C
LFHAVMLAAVRALQPEPATATKAGPPAAQSRVVCSLSGELAGPDCPHHLPQQFWTRGVPVEPCSWHRRSCADSGCPSTEVLPERYSAWAHASGRSLAKAGAAGLPEVVFPKPASRFMLDGNLNAEQQQIVLSAQAPVDARLVFEVDGVEVCEVAVPFKCPWRLRHGRQELAVRDGRGNNSSVQFTVE